MINEIDAQNPVFPDLATDFQYRIMLVVSGDARSPVMRQGEVWRTTETKIISTMKAVATKCALDTSYTSGTLKSVLKGMLIRNKTLESYFKQVATGNPIVPEGTSVESSLFEAIKLSYSPEMTLGCKNDGGLEKLKEKSAELLKWITDA